MKVLIDADGCPVVRITVQLCAQNNIPCEILCDTAHSIQFPNVKTIVYDKGSDSVDFALVNRIIPGDIVITQDYGLAAMSLARCARVLHQDGWEYTRDNIDTLLLVRHTSRKIRNSGSRVKGPQKRTQEHNQAFRDALQQLIQTTVHG